MTGRIASTRAELVVAGGARQFFSLLKDRSITLRPLYFWVS
jgi:hypothetical protein